jgi:hypothetical protein
MADPSPTQVRSPLPRSPWRHPPTTHRHCATTIAAAVGAVVGAAARLMVVLVRRDIDGLGARPQPLDKHGPGLAHAFPCAWRGHSRSLTRHHTSAGLPHRCPAALQRRGAPSVPASTGPVEPSSSSRHTERGQHFAIWTPVGRMVPRHRHYIAHGIERWYIPQFSACSLFSTHNYWQWCHNVGHPSCIFIYSHLQIPASPQ